MCFNRKKGISWQNDLYLSLLQHVKIKNIPINMTTHENISTEQLQNSSEAVFPKYGCRKEYQEKVRYFLQCYHKKVTTDLINMNNNIQSINAPELERWLDYKKILVKSMCLSSIREDIEKFLIDGDYKLHLDVRRTILHEMYNGIKDNADVELRIMKTLNNCLWFNRKEICSEVQRAVSNKSLTNSYKNQDDCFHGFAKKELNISIKNRNILLDIESKLDSELKAVENRVLLNSSNANQINDYKILKQVKIMRQIIRNQSIKAKIISIKFTEDQISHVIIYLCSLFFNFLDKKVVLHVIIRNLSNINFIDFKIFVDANDKLQLMKKLIILNVVSPNNDSLKKYMNGTGRIKRSTKKNILESVYEENVKESHYALLELLILKRYLIKQKVSEMRFLLKKNEIDFQKEIEGMSFFGDLETKFYEVLQNISFTDIQ